MKITGLTSILFLGGLVSSTFAWTSQSLESFKTTTTQLSAATTTESWFPKTNVFVTPDKEPGAPPSLDKLKAQLLQLGAALDRGQAYNPTSGEYYAGTMTAARSKIEQLLTLHPHMIPQTLEDMEGEWELILSTVPHGIFRSSPFFLAIQESYEYAESKGTYSTDVQESRHCLLKLFFSAID
jgi:hypothetical protein